MLTINVEVSIMSQVLASATVTTDNPARVIARTIADALDAIPFRMFEPANARQEMQIAWRVLK